MKLLRIITAQLLLLAGLSGSLSAAGTPLIPADWSRQPNLAVSPLSKAPVVDGIIAAGEWDEAVSTCALYANSTGSLSENKVTLRLGYTADTLYLAWQVYRPRGEEKPKITFPAGWQPDIWTRDDNAEIIIEPGLRSNGIDRYYTIGGNAAGAYSSAFGELGKSGWDSNWKGGWKYNSHVTPYGWEGEVAVPVSQFFKADPLKPGTTWLMDFYINQQTPQRELICLSNIWAYRGNFDSLNKARLTFMDKPVSVHLDKIGVLSAEKIGLQGEVVNRGKADLNLRLKSSFYYAPSLPGEGLKSFIGTWDRIEYVKQTGQPIQEGKEIIFYKGESDYLKELNDRYTFIGENSREVTVKPGEKQLLTAEQPFKYGEYLVNYRLEDKDSGALLASQTVAIAVNKPLDTELTPYFLEHKKIRAITDLKYADLKKGDTLIFRLRHSGSKSVIDEEKTAYSEDMNKTKVYLDTGDTGKGTYTVTVEAKRGGKVLYSREVSMERPEDPSWWNNKLGYADKPPVPWTPLEASECADPKPAPWYGTTGLEHKVSVWNRDYYFKDSFLPERIIARGTNILAAPAELKIEAKGIPCKWKSREITLKEKDAVKARYEYRAVSDNIVLKADILVEYDGMMRFDVELQPVGKGVSLSTLSLNIPVKKEWAKYYWMGTWYTDLKKYKIPGKGIDGVVSDWKNNFPQGIPFTYRVYLGAEDRGIEWMSENDKGWSNASEDRVIFLEESDSACSLKINMVDKETALNQPLKLTWGMMVTPVKDASRGVNQLSRMWGDNPWILGAKDPDERPESADNLKAWSQSLPGLWNLYMNMSDTGHFGCPRTYSDKWHDTLKRAVDRARQQAGKDLPIVYYGSWGVNKNIPDFRSFGREMLMDPVFDCGYDCFWHNPASRAYQDYFLDGVKYMVEELKFSGVKLDGTFSPRLTTNDLNGYGFYRNGELHGSYPLFAIREMCKRLYTMLHGQVIDNGVVTLHAGGGYFVSGFSDIQHHGEAEYTAGDTVLGVISPESYRIRFMTQLNGVATVQMWPDWMNLPVKSNQMRAMALLHDVQFEVYSHNAQAPWLDDSSYEREGRPWSAIVRIMKKFDTASAQWHPYWKNEGIVTTYPEALPASIYLHKGNKALVVISNLEAMGREVTLKIDKEKLGFTKPRVVVWDALKNYGINPEKDGNVKLSFYPQSYRLLEISNW
ncbi:MAG: DUF6067 family protein [bacterium]|nr:DUF6067 family protein [bacterium]